MMSTEEKVSPACQVWDEHGLSPALQLSRLTCYYHQNHRISYSKKNAHLRESLGSVARNHHEYGSQRESIDPKIN